jgi:hypothetical protein
MLKLIIFSVKIVVLIFCVIGILHECNIVISYDALHLKKSKISMVYFLWLFVFGLLYQKTTFFDEAISNIKKSIYFWMLIGCFIVAELILYFMLFGNEFGSSRIHRFAPFNFLVAFWLWLICLIVVFGVSHLGFINKLKQS